MIIIGSRPGQDDIYGWYLHLVFLSGFVHGEEGRVSLEGCDNNEHGRREDSNGEDGVSSRGERRRGGRRRGGEGEGEGEERMKRARETEMRSRVRRTARLDGHRTRDPLYVTGACRAVVVEGEARTGRDRTRRDRTRQKQTRLDSSQEERTGSW